LSSTLQQLILKNSEILKTVPNKVTPTQSDIAIVIHVFYIDIWQEIIGYLQQLEITYDLYITVPQNMPDKDLLQITQGAPDATVFIVENRGRDVLPFLESMSIIGTNTYKYICKLHTKKTGNSAVGNVWRKLLYFDLLGSNKTVENIIKLFEKHSDIGIITGKNAILDSEEYIYGNKPKIEMLQKACNIHFNENYNFAAGTMFWTKSELLEPLINLFKKEKLNFEEEIGQTDNTLAHAIERFFGLLCQDSNKKIIESPAFYSKLNDKTLNEVATLVLSQQYIDPVVHKEHIQALEQYVETLDEQIKKQVKYIQELEALAQSLRLKNRLKKLVPTNIKSNIKKVLKILKTIKDNPLILKKVFYYLKRGELQYLWTKTKEKTRNNLVQDSALITFEPHQYFKEFNLKEYSLNDTVIDIIIPVYNGYEFLEALFDSLEKDISSTYRLIVVNDCSPDEKVKPYLVERLKKHSNAIFIDNKNNLGFVKSVNKAVTHVQNHFVILNTDTELPSMWLERLMFPILNFSQVATTTPFTNSGTIASFPNFLEDNEIFDNLTVSVLDKEFSQIAPDDFYAQMPTGIGFCMGINYDLVQKIGFFDEETFGKGYGEENDWCQRAIQNDYTNLLVPNLFVYHKHGGSFPSEVKQKLISEHYIKLLEKHPNYDKDIQDYIKENPHQTLRNVLIMMASGKKNGIDLLFDHSLGGGANIYTNELLEKYSQEKRNTLLVKYDFYSNNFKLYYHYRDYTFNFSISSFEELTLLISKLNIKEIFLNNLVSFKNSYEILEYLNHLVEERNISLILPIHDFYAICPSYTLQNDKGVYCDIPSLDMCKSCIIKNDLEWNTFYSDKKDMIRWRALWFSLLEKSSKILCFSNSSKEILVKAYPNIIKNKIEVIPHKVENIEPLNFEVSKDSNKITIGILGAINYAKGSQIIKNMVKTIERDNLNIDIVVIGEISEQIKSKHFHVTGRYQHNELSNIIKNNHIDIFLIPSIWPETFSYTTQEIMMMEMPLMVFNLGAPAERVANYSKGYIIDKVNSEAVFETLQEYVDKRGDS